MKTYFVRLREDVSKADLLGLVPRAFDSSRNSYHAENLPGTFLLELDESEREKAERVATIFSDQQFAAFDSGGADWFDAENAAESEELVWARKSVNDVLAEIRAPEAWRLSSGKGVTIVIVDSGVSREALEFPLHNRSDFAVSPAYSDGGWVDSLGHGSMCAAIAAGNDRYGARYKGVAPEATILSARTNYKTADLLKIFDRLVTLIKTQRLKGPVVINNSYGWPHCQPPEMTPDHPLVHMMLAARSAGAVIVCAAGNNHSVCGYDPTADAPNTIWAANSLDEMICVGAVNWRSVNTEGSHAQSSRGPGQWARRSLKPDCVAPSYGEVLWRGTYLALPWWGTSGAAPQVAGLAALILSKVSGRLTPDDVQQAIVGSCRSLPAPSACVGAGLIDCYSTLASL